MWYRWHPYFERSVQCEGFEARANGRVARIVVRPGEVIAVAAWMLDRDLCMAFNLGNPRVTGDALTDLHNLLSLWGFRNALLGSSNAQEVTDEDAAPPDAASRATAVDHAIRLDSAPRPDEGATRDRGRAFRQASDGSRRRRRGGDDR